MKSAIGLLIGCYVLLGCQSYSYYDPEKPHRGKDHFLNNYDNSPKASFLKWQWARLTTKDPEPPPFNPVIVKTDLEYLKNNRTDKTFTWIGHASALLQVDGVNILIDPVFSDRVSPVSFMGPKRIVPVPFKESDLPPVDVIVISHAHYDHLDLPSLRNLMKLGQGKTKFLVGLGDKKLLESEDITNVQEFDWWEGIKFNNVELTFTPAQHWTQRILLQSNKTLWGGWHVKAGAWSFHYTGDTGYSKDFQDIRAKFGPVDVAMIPIGAYEPRWFMKQQHVNPEEALMIHNDLGSKISIGVHWGTFKLADEALGQPPMDLEKARRKMGVSAEAFRVLNHGETLML